MAIYGQLTEAQINQLITQKLIALRDAMDAVRDLYVWTSGLANADLVAAGFASSDAGDILAACSDANALAQIYETGLPPGSYPQPSSAYVYGASQAVVIGPQ